MTTDGWVGETRQIRDNAKISIRDACPEIDPDAVERFVDEAWRMVATCRRPASYKEPSNSDVAKELARISKLSADLRDHINNVSSFADALLSEARARTFGNVDISEDPARLCRELDELAVIAGSVVEDVEIKKGHPGKKDRQLELLRSLAELFEAHLGLKPSAEISVHGRNFVSVAAVCTSLAFGSISEKSVAELVKPVLPEMQAEKKN